MECVGFRARSCGSGRRRPASAAVEAGEGVSAEAEVLADHCQRDVRGRQPADDQHDHLDDVGVADDLHAADRDDRGEHGQQRS